MLANHTNIAQLLRPANGSSQPWFCLLDDGTQWLVKFAGAGPGPRALLAEFIANGLGQLWGLPIPRAIAVGLDSSVPRAGTDEFWDVLAASQGGNLAIEVIPGAASVVPDTELPQDTLESMLAYDTVMVNWDRTALSRNLLRDESGVLWWIDHGSCRYLHHLDAGSPAALPSNHFLFEHRDGVEARALPPIDARLVQQLLASVPHQWMTAGGFEVSSLAEQLVAYLHLCAGDACG